MQMEEVTKERDALKKSKEELEIKVKENGKKRREAEEER
jgi:hypothetical protein